MAMTIEEVDRALADWQARLRHIDQNLVDLEEEPVHRRLQAARDRLEGATRDRVVPALAAMDELFGQRSLLVDVLDRATALRAGVNRRRPQQALLEIESLLRGPSIALPTVHTPLARRSLLDAAETTSSISLDQLLGAMVASFEQARDAVSAVAEAWRRLEPECDRAAAEADRTQALADSLGPDVGEETRSALAAVRAQLEAVRTRMERDPLGASRALTDDVVRRLGQADARLSALRRQREQVLADLERTGDIVTTLRQDHEPAAAASDRCGREIALDAGAAPLPGVPEASRIEGLAQWRGTLEATVARGQWTAAAVGLARWLTAAEALLAELHTAERASRALLEQRDELLGRLLARRQQTLILAARGRRLDPEAELLADRAETLLRQVPTPLAEATALVAAYEDHLRSG